MIFIYRKTGKIIYTYGEDKKRDAHIREPPRRLSEGNKERKLEEAERV